MKAENDRIAVPLPAGGAPMLWIARARVYLDTRRRSVPQQSTKLTGKAGAGTAINLELPPAPLEQALLGPVRPVTVILPNRMVVALLRDPGTTHLSRHPVPCAAINMRWGLVKTFLKQNRRASVCFACLGYASRVSVQMISVERDVTT